MWAGGAMPKSRSAVGAISMSAGSCDSIDAEEPHIVDLAPTALRLFGIEPPAHMDGRPFAVAV